MGKLSIVTVTGFTREEAIASANLNLDVKFDATPAFKKAGAPTNPDYIYAFANEYSQKKHKGLAGAGYFIVVESGVADSRERPYKVETVVTEGTRKYKTVYEGFAEGKLVFSKDLKSEAEEAAKEYVTANKVDVTVRLAKNVVEGQETAMTVKYTPSINTKKGTYVLFGIEA